MKHKILLSMLICGSLIFSAGCSQNNTLQKKYGIDSSYFMGLRAAQLGDEATAIREFKRSAKKGSELISRKSMEALADIGSIDNRIKECFSLYEHYRDEDSLTKLCKELYGNREYAQVISASKDINISECNNELAYYRCSSLCIKNDKSFNQEYLKWCTTRPFQKEQYQLFCEVEKSPAIISLRSLVYIRNYVVAFDRLKPFLENNTYLTPTLLSDFGKILLYGSPEYKENSSFLASLGENASADCLYYIYFYAGRILDKSPENLQEKAIEYFIKAMKASSSPDQYDNALWYCLNSSLKISIDKALFYIEEYKGKWNSPSYFDDFFDALSVKLLSEHSWNNYFKAAKLIRGAASKEATAKYNYVAARLIQEGFINLKSLSAEEATNEMLNVALNSGTDIYYRMLAGNKLGISQDKILDSMKIMRNHKDFTLDEQAERLLLGYAEFGFPELIYDEWTKHSDNISLNCAEQISLFLKNCAASNSSYYTQSLRIASRKFNKTESEITDQIVKLSFPQDFTLSVSKYCQEYDKEESLIYALIRSESYFNPEAISSAQAIGLTQLMEMTAGDIAKKLKKTSYDLTDSDTNIQFGTYYIDEMTRRLNGSKILALFAYNAGINSVRRWVKNSEKEFGKAIPNDLLLESIPYSETREYGRKVLSAAIMYNILYYDTPYTQTIQDILQ